MSREFCRDVPDPCGCSKSLCKKTFLRIFRSLYKSRFLGRGCDEALFSEKRFFSEKGGGNSVNEGFARDLYRKGNSMKRSMPFTEPPDSEN